MHVHTYGILTRYLASCIGLRSNGKWEKRTSSFTELALSWRAKNSPLSHAIKFRSEPTLTITGTKTYAWEGKSLPDWWTWKKYLHWVYLCTKSPVEVLENEKLMIKLKEETGNKWKREACFEEYLIQRYISYVSEIENVYSYICHIWEV